MALKYQLKKKLYAYVQAGRDKINKQKRKKEKNSGKSND